MRKKPRRNGAGWNKGRSQGQKVHFTLPETIQLATHLRQRRCWHDLALLLVGLDTLLRSCDLLKLTVADVTFSNGRVRRKLNLKQQKTSNTVVPTLTPSTQKYLATWITYSGKSPHHFLFTRSKPVDAKPICHKHFVSLIKSWAVWLGYPPDEYAAHTLRRSKAIALYRAGAPMAELSEALGHKSQASTLRYLGITQERVSQMMLSLDMSSGFAERLSWEEPDK
jgi:integrase